MGAIGTKDWFVFDAMEGPTEISRTDIVDIIRSETCEHEGCEEFATGARVIQISAWSELRFVCDSHLTSTAR